MNEHKIVWNDFSKAPRSSGWYIVAVKEIRNNEIYKTIRPYEFRARNNAWIEIPADVIPVLWATIEFPNF